MEKYIAEDIQGLFEKEIIEEAVSQKLIEKQADRVSNLLKSKGKGVIIGGEYGKTVIDLIDLKEYEKHGGVDRRLFVGSGTGVGGDAFETVKLSEYLYSEDNWTGMAAFLATAITSGMISTTFLKKLVRHLERQEPGYEQKKKKELESELRKMIKEFRE